MKIGVTGTRQGMSMHQKEQFVLKLFELNLTEFRHGDCIGADAEAHDIVREFFPDVKIIIYPPVLTKNRAWKKGDIIMEPEPYLTRDHKIVDASEFMIGAPHTDEEVLRSDTWATIRYARKRSRDYMVLKR